MLILSSSLSRTFQVHSIHILKLRYWHFPQGLQCKGVYQRNLSVKTVSWRYDLATFSVKLAGPLQQVPGIVNAALWNVFVYVCADPAVATLPDNKGSVWGEEIQNSHYFRWLPHGSNTRELCQVPWNDWPPTHSARIPAYCFFPHESKATWDSGSSELDS